MCERLPFELGKKLEDDYINDYIVDMSSYLLEGTRGGISFLSKHYPDREMQYVSMMKRRLGSSERRIRKLDPKKDIPFLRKLPSFDDIYSYRQYLLESVSRDLMIDEMINQKDYYRKAFYKQRSRANTNELFWIPLSTFMNDIHFYGAYEGKPFDEFEDHFDFFDSETYPRKGKNPVVYQDETAVRWICHVHKRNANRRKSISKPLKPDGMDNLQEIPKCIWKFKNAEDVDLSDTGLYGMKNIIGMKKLKKIDVSSNPLSFYSILNALKCTGLKEVNANKTFLTRGECRELKELYPDITIHC